MNGKNILKIKAVSTSIFMIIVLVISSSLLPMVNGSTISNPVKNGTITKNEVLILQNKIISLIQRYEHIISKNHLPMIHPQYLKEIFKNKFASNGAASGSSDFEQYWTYYKEILRKWSLIDAETMREFIDNIFTLRGLLAIVNLVFFIWAVFAGIITQQWLVSFFIMLPLPVMDMFFTYLIINTYVDWSILIDYSTTMVIHVTNQNGQGISNLEGHIEAYNIEAYNAIDNGTDTSKEYFTYPLDSDTGYSGTGWYSTSSWWLVENVDSWSKPPCPPGYWHISITDVDGYQDLSMDINQNLLSKKTSIIPITLVAKP